MDFLAQGPLRAFPDHLLLTMRKGHSSGLFPNAPDVVTVMAPLAFRC
jgi:hypothetical protein